MGIKCRLIARGSKDRVQDIETYAGTTSRSEQRMINQVAAERGEFVLSCFDVSQAFAKGMAFIDLSELTGQELREVQFDVLQADVEIMKHIPGVKGFDSNTETLSMLKPMYGLKGAPRAWRKKLHEILVSLRGCKQLCLEFECHCAHEGPTQEKRNPIEWATAHLREHVSEFTPPAHAPIYVNKRFACVVSVHVDDTEGVATREVARAPSNI